VYFCDKDHDWVRFDTDDEWQNAKEECRNDAGGCVIKLKAVVCEKPQDISLSPVMCSPPKEKWDNKNLPPTTSLSSKSPDQQDWEILPDIVRAQSDPITEETRRRYRMPGEER